MKKSILLFLITIFTMTFLAINSFAATIYPVLPQDSPTRMKYDVYENVIAWDRDQTTGENIANTARLINQLVDGDPADEVFDTDAYNYDFIGIVSGGNVYDTSNNSIVYQTPLGIPTEITGYFQYSLLEVAPLATDPTKLELTFELGSDDFFRYYREDLTEAGAVGFNTGTAFDRLDVDDMALQSGVTGGTLWLALEGSDGGTFIKNHSIVTAPGTENAEIANYAWFDPTYFGIPGLELVEQSWPETGDIQGASSENIVSEVYLDNTVLKTTGSTRDLFQFTGQDPLLLYATPEPTTLLLLGFGLLGFAGVARRKNS